MTLALIFYKRGSGTVFIVLGPFFFDDSVSKAVETVSKKSLPSYVKNLVLEICCNDVDGEDVDVPYIKYKFRH